MLVWMFAALGRQCQSLNGHVQVVIPVYMNPNVAFSYYNEFLSPRQCYFSTNDHYFHDPFTYRHYLKGRMHLPDLSNGECRTSNKCDRSELFSLETQRNGNSWFSIFSGKHWQHFFVYCYFSTNRVPVDCSLGLFFSGKMEEKIVQ